MLFLELVKDVSMLRFRVSLAAMSFQKVSTENLTQGYREKETEAISSMHLVQVQAESGWG